MISLDCGQLVTDDGNINTIMTDGNVFSGAKFWSSRKGQKTKTTEHDRSGWSDIRPTDQAAPVYVSDLVIACLSIYLYF